MAKTLTQIGIETGNIVEAYHVTQSIDAFTGTDAYNISLSGSFNMTGSINGEPGVINPLTASYAITASHTLTASYAVSASYEINYETSSSYADTASYVSLIAGPNITINQVGSSFEISGSAGGGGVTPSETGSFYYSSSVDLNTITFYQGDGTTESVTVDTGSANVGTYKVITSTDPGTELTNADSTTQTIIKSLLIPAGTFTTGDIVRVLVFIQYGNNTTQTEVRAYVNSSATIGGSMILGATSADFITVSAAVDGGGGFTRNLHISSSTITSWPSFTADTWKTDEGGDGFWGDSTGWTTGNINWATDRYLVITGKFTSSPSLGDSLNVRAVKITN